MLNRDISGLCPRATSGLWWLIPVKIQIREETAGSQCSSRRRRHDVWQSGDQALPGEELIGYACHGQSSGPGGMGFGQSKPSGSPSRCAPFGSSCLTRQPCTTAQILERCCMGLRHRPLPSLSQTVSIPTPTPGKSRLFFFCFRFFCMRIDNVLRARSQAKLS
jgi:hypothetical protein